MIHWNVDPEIFTLGPLSPRWYGVLFATAFLLSYALMKRMFVDARKPLKDLDSLTITIIVGTMVGARFGHVLFYEPQIILENPLEFFAVWKGGLASHGGALGILTGIWWFRRKHSGYGLLWMLDRMAIVAAISAMCVRLGNFFNSEILGRPTDVPWAIVFERVDALPRHPAQLYEALIYLLVFIALQVLYRKGWADKHPGKLIGIFFTTVFTSRFFIEFLKEYQEGWEASLPIDMGQILSLPFIAVGIWFILKRSA